MLTERLLPGRKEVSLIVPSWRETGRLLPKASPLENVRRTGGRQPLSQRICASDSHYQEAPDRRLAEEPSSKGPSDTAVAPYGETGLPPSYAAVLQQLAKILRSKTFIQSEKLSRFLRFVVEHVIEGHPECLKEYLVGVEVYDRKPPYDPSQDSIVRTEARRLRNKLKEYYGAEGKDDSVYIYLRPGSYIPAFQSREDLIGAFNPAETEFCDLRNSSSVVAAILPFRDVSGNPISAAYAREIPDELAYALMLTDGCTVVSPCP